VSVLYAVLGAVAAQRAAEFAFAAANARRLLARGASEHDPAGHAALVAVHALWLLAMAATIPAAAAPSWPLLAVYAALQPARLWVVASLGRRWTTRLIVPAGMAPVRRGPYRYLRHPNYLVVVGEVAILPLAFGAILLALAFSAANLALIVRRIRAEDAAWAPLREA
jgi:methyltransferase